jgi:very-short-patch-repair endonuclease
LQCGFVRVKVVSMAHSNTFKALSKTSVYKRNKRKRTGVKRNSRMLRYAKRLNADLPKSEVWFHDLFKSHPFYSLFLPNQVIGKYIVDLLCTEKKVVIEVDGSYHDSEVQKGRDFLKDMKLKKDGYTVIRVVAYNMDSFNSCISMLEETLK